MNKTLLALFVVVIMSKYPLLQLTPITASSVYASAEHDISFAQSFALTADPVPVVFVRIIDRKLMCILGQHGYEAIRHVGRHLSSDCSVLRSNGNFLHGLEQGAGHHPIC